MIKKHNLWVAWLGIGATSVLAAFLCDGPIHRVTSPHLVRAADPLCNWRFDNFACNDIANTCSSHIQQDKCTDAGNCQRCASPSFTETCTNFPPYNALDCALQPVSGGCGWRIITGATCQWVGTLSPPCQCTGGIQGTDKCNASYASVSGPCQ